MTAPIANYTTKVPATKTAYEIVSMLGEKRAKAISLDYDAGGPSGVRFVIDAQIDGKPHTIEFRLPCDWRRTKGVLAEHQRSTKKRFSARTAPIDDEWARRVAWRCLRDWVRAQFAMIEIGAAQIEQVMLPYAIVGGRTIYERMVESRFGAKALPEGGAS